MQRMAGVKIDDIRKSYGAVEVIHGLNVDTSDGEFVALLGPSGSGKSTLPSMVAGLEPINSGTIAIGSRVVNNLPPSERDIAMVFQTYALYPHKSVAENMGFALKVSKTDRAEIDRRVREAAEILSLTEYLDRKPRHLSGGQRQRVAMGRAIVRDPQVFLFDEPLSNLDAKLRVEMRAEIKRLHKTTGASIVYVTHDQIEAMTLASRIVVLKGGVVQQIGTPQEIYDRPANTFVADFMGSPPMNIIPAEVSDGQVMMGDVSLPAPVGLSGKVQLGIRPEHLALGGSDLQVTPTMIENTGAECYLNFVLNGVTVTARLPGRMDENSTDSVRMSIAPGALNFFDDETGMRIDL